MRDQVRVIGQFFAVQAKAFALFPRLLDEGLDFVLGGRRTNSQSPGEVRLIAIAKGSLPVGELAVVGVEGVGAFGVGSDEPLLLGEGMYFLRGGVVGRVVADVGRRRDGERHSL